MKKFKDKKRKKEKVKIKNPMTNKIILKNY